MVDGDLKGFRIIYGDSRKGIAAKSFKDLNEKTKIKLNIDDDTKLFFFLKDGTEIEDEEYWKSLANNSYLIVSLDGKTPTTPHFNNHLDEYLKKLHGKTTKEIISSIHDLWTSTSIHEKSRIRFDNLLNYVADLSSESKILASSIKEDPDWFSDLSTNAKTKEEYLSKSCAARIRGYLSKAESQLLKEKSFTKEFQIQFQEIIDEFKAKLKSHKYHGYLFDRSHPEQICICNSNGDFQCEGKFDSNGCQYPSNYHKINPYQSKESRILFSTWNLDHGIERSRAIIPSLIEAVKNLPTFAASDEKNDIKSLPRQSRSKNPKKRNMESAAGDDYDNSSKRLKININYFYSLLFTRVNLKLVHIVCHDKQTHSSKTCDPNKFFINQ